MARPQQTRYVLHQEDLRTETIDEFEVPEKELIARVTNACIIDPMRREALAGRTAEHQITIGTIGEVGLAQFLGRQGQYIG